METHYTCQEDPSYMSRNPVIYVKQSRRICQGNSSLISMETKDIHPGEQSHISRKSMKYIDETYEISQGSLSITSRNPMKYLKETYLIFQ